MKPSDYCSLCFFRSVSSVCFSLALRLQRHFPPSAQAPPSVALVVGWVAAVVDWVVAVVDWVVAVVDWVVGADVADVALAVVRTVEAVVVDGVS